MLHFDFGWFIHFRKHTGWLLDTQDIKFDKMCITNYI